MSQKEPRGLFQIHRWCCFASDLKNLDLVWFLPHVSHPSRDAPTAVATLKPPFCSCSRLPASSSLKAAASFSAGPLPLPIPNCSPCLLLARGMASPLYLSFLQSLPPF